MPPERRSETGNESTNTLGLPRWLAGLIAVVGIGLVVVVVVVVLVLRNGGPAAAPTEVPASPQNPTPIGVVPVADFTASPVSGDPPLTVAFVDASSGAPTAWQWDFQNDGVIDNAFQNPSFTFFAPGSYDVRLKVIGGGQSDEVVKTGLIMVSAPPP